MENKIAELKKIKEALEVLINESEKPKRVSGWYKDDQYTKWLMYFDFENNKRYGFDLNGLWFTDNRCDLMTSKDYKATPSEVQEALEKEAVKRGFKEGVIFIAPTSKNRFTAKGEIEIWESNDTFGLSFSDSQGLILDNGEWAEIIKTKTIYKIAMDLRNFTTMDKVRYLTENKQTIIETLNNL